MKIRSAVAFALAGTFLAASPASALVIFSDNFESYTQSVPWNGGGNWNVTQGSVDLVTTPNFGISCSGGTGNCVDLIGTAAGGENTGEMMNSIAFNLVAGEMYTFSFDYSGNQRGAEPPALFEAYIGGGAGGGHQPFYFNSGTLASSFPWTTHSTTFTAVSTGLYTISFDQNVGSDNQGNLIDNVLLINAVPEPATWAMMLIGFGAVGYSMRRRSGTQKMPQMV